MLRFSKATLLSWLFSAALIGLTLWAYFPTLHHSSILDDGAFYLDDPVMEDPRGLYKIWLEPKNHNGVWPYIPLTRTTFWIERQVVGLDLKVTHAINLGLHLLAAFLLWGALRQWGVRYAEWVALFFAVHPVYVQSVAWIAERKNGVALVWYLLALWSYGRFEISRQWRWYSLTVVLFGAALLSKTSTIMLPVVLIGLQLWRGKIFLRSECFKLLPFFVLALLAGLGRIGFESEFFASSLPDRPWLERFLVAGHVPFFYLTKLVVPYPLVFTYPQWLIDPWQWTQYLPWGSLGIIGGLCLWKYRTWGKHVGWAFAIYGVTLFPVMGFFKNAWTQYSFVADHWVQIPSLSILVFLVGGSAYGISRWFGKQNSWGGTSSFGESYSLEKWHYFVMGLAGVLVLGLTFLTRQQTQVYQNHQTLWEATVRQNPASWLAHLELGRVALNSGNYPQALVYLDEALRLQPKALYAYANRGLTYTHLQQHERALQDFQKALELQPQYVRGYYNRGNSHAHLKQYDFAIRDYSEALRLDPNYVEALSNRGLAYALSGRYEAALEDYDRALQLNPDFGEVYYNRGNLFLSLKNFEQALYNYTQALERNPEHLGAYNNRGTVYVQLQQYDLALQNYSTWLEYQPQAVSAYRSRGYVYWLSGEITEACEDFRKVCELATCPQLLPKMEGCF